jgi:hypothetical protein
LGAPVTDERHQYGNEQEMAFVVHSDSASEGARRHHQSPTAILEKEYFADAVAARAKRRRRP